MTLDEAIAHLQNIRKTESGDTPVILFTDDWDGESDFIALDQHFS